MRLTNLLWAQLYELMNKYDINYYAFKKDVEINVYGESPADDVVEIRFKFFVNKTCQPHSAQHCLNISTARKAAWDKAKLKSEKISKALKESHAGKRKAGEEHLNKQNEIRYLDKIQKNFSQSNEQTSISYSNKDD